MKTNKPAKATTHFEQVPLAVVKQIIDEPAPQTPIAARGVLTEATATAKRPRRLPRRS